MCWHKTRAGRVIPALFLMKKRYYYCLISKNKKKHQDIESARAYRSPGSALVAGIQNLMHYAYQDEFDYNALKVYRERKSSYVGIDLVYSLKMSEICNLEHING